MKTKELLQEKTVDAKITEMADAHCHLDLIKDRNAVTDSIGHGVRTIITNGTDTISNLRSIELADMKHIFAMVGIDPEHAGITDEELEFNVGMVKQNIGRITGIGEIGLDYLKARDAAQKERQRAVFERFLDLAMQLKLPVSIHSRNAMDDILQILDDKGMESAHIHFFEGNMQQARSIERKGYMISVPPVRSSKKEKVIKEIAIDNIMAESDAPAVGASPRDVEKSINIVAEAKRIDFSKAAELLTRNTKRFFRIKGSVLMRRY